MPSDYRQRDKGEKTRQNPKGEKVRYKRRRMKFLRRKKLVKGGALNARKKTREK